MKSGYLYLLRAQLNNSLIFCSFMVSLSFFFFLQILFIANSFYCKEIKIAQKNFKELHVILMYLPESPPIKGLFSKCSTKSLKHEKVPIPNLYCEPSHPIWKCLTELAHLKQKKINDKLVAAGLVCCLMALGVGSRRWVLP